MRIGRFVGPLFLSGVLGLLWVLLWDRRGAPSHSRDAAASGAGEGSLRPELLSSLLQFFRTGRFRTLFPEMDTRDSSIQFELISQVHCTTTVGRPISASTRNQPADRRRMFL